MQVLITGTSKGIGRALASHMVAKGHTVLGVARNETQLKELQQELGSHNFIYTVADLATDAGIQQVIQAVEVNDFYPDWVYLNAGVYSTSDETFSTEEHYNILFNTNMHAPVKLYQRFMQLPVKPSLIVFISSLFALLPDTVNPAYAASKAGATMAFQSLANSNAETDVKIVYLGPVDTKVNSHAKKNGGKLIVSPKQVAQFLGRLPNRTKQEFVYPFTSKVFYLVFSRVPRHVYEAFMKKARR